MERRSTASGWLPQLAAATVVSLALYYPQALLLLLKLGEVFGGVFDTSVPAFPLAGMFFVVIFIALRRDEFLRRLEARGRDAAVASLGVALAALPLVPLLAAGQLFAGSYAYAAVALASCWVGVLAVVRPSTLGFLWPYLALFVAAVGSVSLLTAVAGDPLAIVVASVSGAMTWLFGLPVQWSSVFITFSPAGSGPIELFISQECSGIASVSIFLLLVGLMHLDMGATRRSTVVMAAGGTALFVFLNAARVVVLIAGGIYGGQDLLWSLHGWVGYEFYIMGNSFLLLVYTRTTGAVARPGQPSARL